MLAEAYASEFPVTRNVIYLNHAGVAPWPKRAGDAMTAFAMENIAWGATRYPDWMRRETHLREQLRRLIRAPSIDDIALVKNTSEALSFVAMGLGWRRGDNIVSTDEEFPSNRIPWQALAPLGVELRQATLRRSGSPETALMELVDRNTRLIAVSSVQYGSGIRLNLPLISEFCRQRNILLCVDAIQSIGALDTDIGSFRPDFLMADGHKWMLGPEGLGLFYTSAESRDRLRLTQFGWHMVEDSGNYDNKQWRPARSARRFECGSPNMAGIAALSASLSLLLEVGMSTVERTILENTAFLNERIRREPRLELLSPEAPAQRSGIVVFRRHGSDPALLVQALRDFGVVAAARGGGVRFSPHFYTPRAQLEEALQLLLRIAERP